MAPLGRELDARLAARLAGIALSCVGREYPNQIAHAMRGDADVGTPRTLHPAFFGSYDWHSAVHGHWCIVRLLRVAGADAPWAEQAGAALAASLTRENLASEADYLRAPGRETFERPYGLAWVLQLDAELRGWDEQRARPWLEALAPLTRLCAERLLSWSVSLTHPVRTGVHSQSAFALSLALDWARAAGDGSYGTALAGRAAEMHRNDRGWRLEFEPSGEDFLSPSLGEADLMRRVLPPDEFARWLRGFLPQLDGPDAPDLLRPPMPPSTSDGRLAHLDGLHLSRAWMLEGIASGLPASDARRGMLLELGATHLERGLRASESPDYARAHWLASFAVYALSGRGVEGR